MRVLRREEGGAVVRYLTCCCCGAGTEGEQWHNRDTGYGLCLSCADWIEGRGMSSEDMQSAYGTRGVHYAPAPKGAPRA